MEEQFLEVWRDGELWFEFPAINEDNVRLDLMKRNLDRVCEIRPKVADVQILKQNIAKQVSEIDLSATLPSEAVKPQRKPKAEKATHTHDIS